MRDIFLGIIYVILILIYCLLFQDHGPATDEKDLVSNLVTKPSEEANRLFLQKQSEVFPLSAILSAYPDYCEPFVPPEITQDFPPDLTTLWDPTAVGMHYEDLLELCSSLYEVVISSSFVSVHKKYTGNDKVCSVALAEIFTRNT